MNIKIQDDTPLGRLMQDLSCAEPEKMHYKELAETVNYFKTTKEGALDMTDIIELYAENKARKAAEKAAYQTSVELAENMLADKMSVEAVARYSKLPIEEVRKLAEKQSA